HAGGGVPEFGGAVEGTGGSKCVPVRGPREAVDVAAVADQGANELAGFGIPDVNDAVHAAGGDFLAVRAEGGTGEGAAMAAGFDGPTHDSGDSRRTLDGRANAERIAAANREWFGSDLHL